MNHPSAAVRRRSAFRRPALAGLVAILLLPGGEASAAPSAPSAPPDPYQRATASCLSQRALEAQRPLQVVLKPLTVGGNDWRPLLLTPRVCLNDLMVSGIKLSGTLPYTLLHKQSRSHAARLSACAARLPRSGPVGLAWIELTVDAAGQVIRQAVTGSPAVGPLARCVAQVMVGWQYFPPVTREGKVSLSLVVLAP